MMARNSYGFDFLRAEHKLDEDDEHDDVLYTPHTAVTNGKSNGGLLYNNNNVPEVPNVSQKNDLEKQFDVIQFLQAHRSSGCLPPSIIYAQTGIDLIESHNAVAKMLFNNAKIRVEEIPDPENPSLTIYTFGYQAKFNNIHNKVGLLAQINRCKNGVKRNDLMDAYEGVEEDLAILVRGGEILAVANPEDKDIIYFPRGEAFLVELDGHVVLPDGVDGSTEDDNSFIQGKKGGDDDVVGMTAVKWQRLVESRNKNVNCFMVETDVDPKKQIRRGEAVWVGGQWFRLSSAVRDGVPLSEQPARAQAPPSVALQKDLSKKNEMDGYIRPFDTKRIPLDHALSGTALTNLKKAKEAQEHLHKIAGGRGVTGGASAQLLSSNASAANPESLAASFASSAGSGAGAMRRSRPAGPRSGGNAHPSQKDVIDQVEQAKKAASDPCLMYCHARRHGCTVDVRDAYLATRADVPESEVELYNLMIKHKLIEPGEPMRRPRIKIQNKNLDNDGKPKKRRYYERRGQRITNTHLIGTEIGAELARAAEKQQQGKSVGDGGM